ncbi:metallophosphoesterase [uncultured Bacteroides sp.]|uniref:metallophosphoesterase family protein n=1 Tax=uncultured Bacteroides sp. TaxID=162156 RepID=UPI002AABC16B|nr:metallophosphoesterase [uncultured Bacteroides sp.]
MKRYAFVLFSLVSLCSELSGRGCYLSGDGNQKIRFAVLSDVHLQDTTYVSSMDSQLHSTRLFNENYLAFLAALDDVARRDIHYILLPGDLTDDGQLMNVRKVREILDSYSARHDMHFLLMTGNHDPSRPFITSDSLGEMKRLGYKDIHREWCSFGFWPQKEYLFWATPFSTYNYENYNYEEAVLQADWGKRTYVYKGKKPAIPDGSYLVEPVKGLWVLAIDASVYNPQVVVGDSIQTFDGAKGGYNDVLKIKSYLLPWITKVAAEAKKYGKKLVAFSHYPMADYNDGVAKYITDIAAPGKFDVYRFPNPAIAELLADAGVTIHFGGHIHMNNEEVYVSKKGNHLLNVQVPSTAGYIPAYKILTLDKKGKIKVETVSLDSVKGFNSFFPRYRAEHDSLRKVGKQPLWSESILDSKTYRQFCEAHLKELTRLRYLPNDLKTEARTCFAPMTAAELFAYAGIKGVKAADWTGFDMLVDFYKLRFGGKLALKDIDFQRLEQYKKIARKLVREKPITDFDKFLASFCRIFLAHLED